MCKELARDEARDLFADPIDSGCAACIEQEEGEEAEDWGEGEKEQADGADDDVGENVGRGILGLWGEVGGHGGSVRLRLPL